MTQIRAIDILHVEEDDVILTGCARQAEKKQLKYLGVPTLRGLAEALATARARIYGIDGDFPNETGGEIQFNAPQAVQLIRQAAGNE